MNLFGKKSYFSLDGSDQKKKSEKRKKVQEPSIPDGMWIKCNTCKNIIYKKEVTEYKLCPSCGAHFRMSPSERIAIICDKGSFKELDSEMAPKNPMKERWSELINLGCFPASQTRAFFSAALIKEV